MSHGPRCSGHVFLSQPAEAAAIAEQQLLLLYARVGLRRIAET
jgi:hypothetical protein